MELAIPFIQPALKPSTEYWLNLHLTLRQATKWAQAGHEVAWEQIYVPFKVPGHTPLPVKNMPAVHFEESRDEIVITSSNFRLVLNKQSGMIKSYRYQNTELFVRGPVFKGWRAPTDNDATEWGEQKAAILWRKAGLDRLAQITQAVKIEQVNPNAARISVKGFSCAPDTEEGFDLNIVYTVYGNGDIVIDTDVKPAESLPPLPRIGLELALPQGFEQFTWYGRGPHENYLDRKESASINVHTGSVNSQYHPYVKPQETGNKTDVRWAAVTNSQGFGLMAIGMPTLQVTALHFYADDLAAVKHTYELKPRDEIILNLDWKQTGLGGNSCGPGTLPQYRIFPEPVNFSICLRPLAPGAGELSELGKQIPTAL